MTSDQRAQISTALARYGAELSGDFIAKGDKVLSVSFEVKKNRLRVMGGSERLLASYPVSRIGTGVSDFVEKFWYWKPIR
jgi:hypothetical protein